MTIGGFTLDAVTTDGRKGVKKNKKKDFHYLRYSGLRCIH